VRRVFVALVAAVVVAVVWGIVGAVRGLAGGDGDGGGGASPVVAERDPSPTPSTTSAAERPRPRSDRKKAEGSKPEKERLARPSGPCADGDVVVTPEVEEPYVGAPRIVLLLTTVEADACTWEVSPDSVFLDISDDKGPLWSSQHCPDAIPTEEVVPRREKPARVVVAWNGKQSDPECSEATEWVRRGEYVASAIAGGSVTPVDVGFVMVKHPPVEVPAEEPERTERRRDR
jgi:hypothetical protein